METEELSVYIAMAALIVSIVSIRRSITRPAWKVEWEPVVGRTRYRVVVRNIGEGTARKVRIRLETAWGERYDDHVITRDEDIFPGEIRSCVFDLGAPPVPIPLGTDDPQLTAPATALVRVHVHWHQAPWSRVERRKEFYIKR